MRPPYLLGQTHHEGLRFSNSGQLGLIKAPASTRQAAPSCHRPKAAACSSRQKASATSAEEEPIYNFLCPFLSSHDSRPSPSTSSDHSLPKTTSSIRQDIWLSPPRSCHPLSATLLRRSTYRSRRSFYSSARPGSAHEDSDSPAAPTGADGTAATVPKPAGASLSGDTLGMGFERFTPLISADNAKILQKLSRSQRRKNREAGSNARWPSHWQRELYTGTSDGVVCEHAAIIRENVNPVWPPSRGISRLPQRPTEPSAKGAGERAKQEWIHFMNQPLPSHVSYLWQSYEKCCQAQSLRVMDRIRLAERFSWVVSEVTKRCPPDANLERFRERIGRRISHILEDVRVFSSLALLGPESRKPQQSHIRNIAYRAHLLEVESTALKGDMEPALTLFGDLAEVHREELLDYLDGRLEAGKEGRKSSERRTHFKALSRVLATLLDHWLLEYKKKGFFAPGRGRLRKGSRREVNLFPQKSAAIPDGEQDVAKLALRWMVRRPQLLTLIHFDFPASEVRFNDLVAAMPDPLNSTLELAEELGWESVETSYLCKHVILSLANRRAGYVASQLFVHASDNGVEVGQQVARRLMRILSFTKESAAVDAVLQCLSRRVQADPQRPWSSSASALSRLEAATLKLLVLHYARQGDWRRAQHAIESLKRGHPDHTVPQSFISKARLICASTIGDVADCLEVLEEGYDLTAERAIDVAPGKRMLDVEAFFFLIQAFSRQDDIHGAVEQFEYMKSLGIRPTTLVYNLMIGLYARRVDVSSAMSLLSTMREEGVRPDKVTFNSLLHMFVKRKDPTSALATAKAMIEQGCRPDMFTYVTLMDAYVEVGEWESAIRIYRYMRDSGDPTLKPNTAACNTVLKVYLLRPSPVQDVMSVVEDMKRASVQLNSRTFALMLQSACDAGLMKMAEEIFTEAEKSLPPVNGRLVGEGANMYHFSIMINAYLKMGNLKEAREYFDEMRRRGMEPGPITWSMLMSSYVSSGNEANFELARQLVVQLVAEEESPPESRQVWDSPSLKQGPPFESLFLPLLIARAKRNEPDLAEKVFEDLQSSGSNVSIQSYTALLDAYRRAGEVEAALRLWERMYSDVLRMSSQDLTPLKAKPSSDRSMTSRDGFKDPLRRNLICLPLSIMVELLTRAERFDEIASIWSRAKSDGFGFDPHNWNHLAVALCKSGRLREALNVIENVLPVPAPNWEAIRRQHEENLQHPSADDTSGQGAATEEGEEDEEEKEGGQGPVEKVETERGDVKEKEEERLDSDRMGDSEELDDFNRVETPIRPPNRRGYDRIRDDPFTILPFDERDEDASEEDIADFTSDHYTTSTDESDPSAEEEEEDVEPRRSPALIRTESRPRPRPSRPDKVDLSQKFYERQASWRRLEFNAWFAHFETLQALEEGLESELGSRRGMGGGGRSKMQERTLAKEFPKAFNALRAHRLKVEGIEERSRMDSETSVRAKLSNSDVGS